MGIRNLQIPSDIINELGVPQIVDITDQLPKNKVKDWDALNAPRKLEALTDSVWHHTAVPKYSGADAAVHAKNHIDYKGNEVTGDGGMPYHFYISNGLIQQCNDICTFVYAVSGNNYQTVNTAVEGLYSGPDSKYKDWDREVSDEDKRCMIALEITLRRVLPNYRRTNGHNFYQAKACPGFSMSKFREEVALVENKLAYMTTDSYAKERAFKIANQILFFYNLAQGKNPDGTPATSGNIEWGKNVLLLLDPFMTEKGLL